MNQVEIKVAIDVTDSKHVQALNIFLTSIGGNESTETTKEAVQTEVQTEAPERKRTRRTKEQIAADKEAEEVKKKESEEGSEPTQVETAVGDEIDTDVEDTKEEETTTLKIEDIRPILAKKVGDHRQAIKDKLTAFGAPNLTALDASHYAEFMDFLNKLA